ncbi:MAG: hypothetical protein WCC22_13405 [Terriglobales bacterium]
MSGFLLLHWPEQIDPTLVESTCYRACTALRRSHPESTSLQVTNLTTDRFWCVKLDAADRSFVPVFKNARDGSWVFVLGSATYEGKRLSDSVLPRLLADVRLDSSAASRRLDGVFVVVAFDRARNQIVVIPSPLGQYANYVRSTAQGIVAISSSILALAAMGPVTLDEFGCYSLYQCGHRLPPNTVFREIHSIAEGSLAEIGEGRLSVRRYWAPAFDRPAVSFTEAATEISRQLSSYCVSLIEPDAAVVSDLTGGFDSRVTTASLLRAGISFLSTVAGSPAHPDVLVARHICEKEGLPLQVFDPAEDARCSSQKIESALLLAEGCIDTLTCAVTAQVKEKLFARFDLRPFVAISGGLGECYRDHYWVQEFFDRGKRQRASVDKLIRYRLDPSPKRMDFLAKDWHSDWRIQLRDFLGQIVDAYPGERNTSQLDAVFLRKMTGLFGGFSSAFVKRYIPLLPFSSINALDIALSAPPRWRYGARLQRRVAWLLHPRFANYMTLKGCPCAPVRFTNLHKFVPKYIADVQRLVRKASTVWLGRTMFPEYREPEPRRNPCTEWIDEETRPGGSFDFDSMHTGNWYAPQAFAALLREARLPNGVGNRDTLSWIYTCEAMARMAHSLQTVTVKASSVA